MTPEGKGVCTLSIIKNSEQSEVSEIHIIHNSTNVNKNEMNFDLQFF